MPDDELIPRDKIRDKAKILTDKRRRNYVEGRLGLVIDGTGKDLDKITNQASDLKQIGYDVYMIFVNTSLDVALENNQKRARTLKDSIVDNNEVDKDGRLFDKVFKRVKSMLSMKVNNPAAQRWIDREIQARRR